MKKLACKASNKPSAARLAAAIGAVWGSLRAGDRPRGFVPIAPGHSSVLAASSYQDPDGNVVATESTPFTAKYQPNGTLVSFSGVATGQFNDQVLRDPKTGDLTFVYSINLNNEGYTSASQGAELTVGGYGTYQTGVAGRLQFEPTGPILRSADGSSLSFYANTPGLGGPPELAVKTNATKFDSNGVVTFSLADTFLVNGPHGEELENVWGTVSFKGAFRPAGIGGVGGTTVAVPLPPAFYTGLGVMMACGVISLVRRLMGS